jgi:RNA polymerase sigma-70 factor, ECF subfamily
MRNSIVGAFVAAAESGGAHPELLQTLSQVIADAEKQTASVALPAEALAAALGRAAHGSPDLVSALRTVRAAELRVASACLAGDVAAQQILGDILNSVPKWIRRIDSRPEFAEDVRQEAFHILVADTPHPQLLRYSGKGALGAFVRVVATRLALHWKRLPDVRQHADIPDSLASHEEHPEIALLRRRHADEFSAAFKASLAVLPLDERNILRLHYIDGLTIEQVGTAYGVSRATAARMLARARAHVAREAQARLAERLGANSPGAATLLALVESQLGASIASSLNKS